jgi:hypothetical protein
MAASRDTDDERQDARPRLTFACKQCQYGSVEFKVSMTNVLATRDEWSLVFIHSLLPRYWKAKSEHSMIWFELWIAMSPSMCPIPS